MRKLAILSAAVVTASLTWLPPAAAQSPATPGNLQTPAETVGPIPFVGSIRIVKPGRGGGAQPLVTTCSAGTGESCALFASNCIVAGGYYDGDSKGGTCCSGVDHPDTNPSSACS
jgi:hypothetical protein